MTSTKNAFPNKQYDGSIGDFANYLIDYKAWVICMNFQHILDTPDPKDTPRNRETESQESYDLRLHNDASQSKWIWAQGIRGFSDDARTTASETPDNDARRMFAEVHKTHGDKSERQVSVIVREFISRNKTIQQKTAKYNTDWKEAVRIMDANGMTLPDKFLVNLYLLSLGEQFKTFNTMIQLLPEDERTLSKVMKLAADQTADDTDEADTRGVAFRTQHHYQHPHQQYNPNKRNYHDFQPYNEQAHYGADRNRQQQQQNGCQICGNLFHSKDSCFAPGGGLQHLDKEGRDRHIKNLREKRSQRHNSSSINNNNYNSSSSRDENNNNKTNQRLMTERAELALQITDLEEENEELRNKVG
jgi:hypothetical protein